MTDDLISKSNDQAERPSAVGTAAVVADHKLDSYVGRVLGTAPEDVAGFVIGDPLRLLRTEIASQYDDLLTKFLTERGVRNPQPVTLAIAIPLLCAAYDECRAELQDLWARLLAAAMDPSRASAVRQSFIAAAKQLDPLDVRVLVWMSSYNGPDIINVVDRACKELQATADEIQISFSNLARVGCIAHEAQRSQRAILAPFGRQLLSTCYG